MGEEKELTILFADVVGSTKLYDVLGDSKARDAVSYCVEVMTSATQQHNGTVIKTMGDEVMATFVSVDDAIDAAAQMQESISDELVVDDVPVSIRIGCHYGPAIVEPNDVFGNAVNTASRMTSQAKSGQIITTLSTVNRLSEQWQSATRQIDLAPVKGKKDEIALFEVLWKREDITSMVPSLSWEGDSDQGELTLRYKNQEVVLNESKPVVHLGRADDNDLVVNNHLISRLHCRVELTRGKIRIIDESTNGTFILNNKGQELFVRRDSLRLEGEGFIGLGKVVQPDSPHAIYFSVKS
ncbi:MAG: adenylate/guanylate cyclase domain-containing protein [Pseudomonadota bacterium]